MTIAIGFPQLEVIPGTCLKRQTVDVNNTAVVIPPSRSLRSG